METISVQNAHGRLFEIPLDRRGREGSLLSERLAYALGRWGNTPGATLAGIASWTEAGERGSVEKDLSAYRRGRAARDAAGEPADTSWDEA